MWIVVLFDLPTDTVDSRKAYTKFRKSLLNDGFSMMQYSVYMRHSIGVENQYAHIKRVKSHLPPDGEIRIISFTDKQFGKMEVYYGEKRTNTESPPLQLQFF